MKKLSLLLFSAVLIGLCGSCRQAEKVSEKSGIEASFDHSLLYIDVSVSRYDGFQPWKLAQPVSISCFGTAVGPHEILTLAEPLADASLIQVKVYGGTKFIPASIKVIDYDLNLCLLEISPDAIEQPLQPVLFADDYAKGMELTGNWLSPDGTSKNSRGFIDRAVALPCPTSYQRTLAFVISNTSRQTSRGELYTKDHKPVGIAFSSSEKDVFLIPGETILRFLDKSGNTGYNGFGTPGYESYDLLDPSVRKYLKMPAEMKDGDYVSYVYSYGTGSDVLKFGDVVLSIDGHPLNAYGKYMHPRYEDISFEHLIQKHELGDPITFTVWRNGEQIELKTDTSRFDSKDMLVPYQEYDRQPEYMVVGGYVFQKLTRDYLQLWGDNWAGKTPPHLYHYYRDLALKPTKQRKEIVILSFVLPAPINLGYQNLGRIVVKSFNGMEIREMSDLAAAVKKNPESPFHVVEFEMEYPTLVIPKENLQTIDQTILQLYGIQKPENMYE